MKIFSTYNNINGYLIVKKKKNILKYLNKIKTKIKLNTKKLKLIYTANFQSNIYHFYFIK